MISRLTLAAFVTMIACTTGCNREADTTPAGQSAAAPVPAEAGHAMRGVVVDLLPDQSALMVKHEDMPGFMRAMTMAFKVEPDVLKTATKGQTIEAVAFKRGSEFWLRDVTLKAP